MLVLYSSFFPLSEFFSTWLRVCRLAPSPRHGKSRKKRCRSGGLLFQEPIYAIFTRAAGASRSLAVKSNECCLWLDRTKAREGKRFSPVILVPLPIRCTVENGPCHAFNIHGKERKHDSPPFFALLQKGRHDATVAAAFVCTPTNEEEGPQKRCLSLKMMARSENAANNSASRKIHYLMIRPSFLAMTRRDIVASGY